jgi:hypothetical protein
MGRVEDRPMTLPRQVVSVYSYPLFVGRVVRLEGRAICWACVTIAAHEEKKCRFRSMELDAHHVLPKQLLKREFPRRHVREDGSVRTLDDLLMDPRNGLLLARYHHDALEARMLVVPRSRLPVRVEEFAGELGLGWYLDRTFGERRDRGA